MTITAQTAKTTNIGEVSVIELLTVIASYEAEQDNLPGAAPLDLLSGGDYQEMLKYISANFSAFQEYIDENYVALLVALSEYEDINFTEKIKNHIIDNMISGKSF